MYVSTIIERKTSKFLLGFWVKDLSLSFNDTSKLNGVIKQIYRLLSYL